MWKIFLIGTSCLIVACVQCDKNVPCSGQTTFPNNTMYQQEQIVAPRLLPEIPNNSSTANPLLYYLTAPVTPVQNANAGWPTKKLKINRNTVTPQPHNLSTPLPTDASTNAPASRSPVIFPGQFENTQIPSESFSIKLFQLMSAANTNRNLLLSPMSLQTILSFIYTISEGKLSQELANILELPQNRSYVAQQFEALSRRPYNSNVNNTITMANKLYYEQRFGIVHQKVRNLAVNSFASDVDLIDLLAPVQASNLINSWVAEKTHNLIKNIITPDSIGPDTRAVLINSLYFKSIWQEKFATADTEKQPFFLNQQRQVFVNMMYIVDVFPYGELEELNAKVVELPYQLDDFRMMIILPNEIDGLSKVEKNLAKVSLKAISAMLQKTKVTIKLPKFQIEFEADLVQPLRQLGLFSLFNDDAKIRLFKNQHKPLSIDQIKQKTVISVNEAGTEAAAGTYATFVPLSIPLRIKPFTADHPFIFVIRNSNSTYFMGHVAHFNDQNED